MTAPLHRVYLSDADYALLDAEQDRRYQASIAGILAENAAAWERHVGSAIQASAPLSHPANLGQLRVTLEITVDPEAWQMLYGEDPTSDNGRDLADYVLHSIMGSAATDAGCITRVDLR